MQPITLEGRHVTLAPLTPQHEEALVVAATDGELWHSTVTIIPTRETMAEYIKEALAAEDALPFVIINKATSRIVGTTRFYFIRPNDHTVAIGYTWLSSSAQRTAINTESKLLLLTHAFEEWQYNRVEFITDVLNEQSRAALVRLGAKQEGILRSHLVLPNGRIRDSVVYSIIKDEWPDVKRELAARV